MHITQFGVMKLVFPLLDDIIWKIVKHLLFPRVKKRVRKKKYETIEIIVQSFETQNDFHTDYSMQQGMSRK